MLFCWRPRLELVTEPCSKSTGAIHIPDKSPLQGKEPKPATKESRNHSHRRSKDSAPSGTGNAWLALATRGTLSTPHVWEAHRVRHHSATSPPKNGNAQLPSKWLHMLDTSRRRRASSHDVNVCKSSLWLEQPLGECVLACPGADDGEGHSGGQGRNCQAAGKRE